MKTLLNKLCLIALLLNAPLLYNGCGSTPVQTAIKAEAPVITGVNAAMTAWSKYVNSGKATQTQVDSVKNAYITYYNAQMIVKATLEVSLSTTNSNSADVASANTAVSNAETALLNLVATYLPVK